jgi:hypothetical protein
MIRRVSVLAILMVFTAGALGALDFWAEQFGQHPRYRLPTYLTGFGSVEKWESDALESARLRALDDLVRKVRVSIKSELVSESQDDGSRAAGSFTSLTRSTSELEVAQPQFLTDQDSRRYYVLAYVRVADLSESYLAELEDTAAALRQETTSIEEHIAAGRISAAEESLRSATTLLEQIASDLTVVSSLERLAPRSTEEVIARRTASIEERTREAAELIRSSSTRIQEFVPHSFEGLVSYLSNRLELGERRIANTIPFRYENTDFTSEFGARLSQALASSLRQSASGREAPVVLEGAYWVDEGSLEVIARLRDPETAEVLSSSRVNAERGAAGGRDIEATNAQSAAASQQTLIGDAIVDGGISLEVWTNKGRQQDVLAFEEGEEVQFYFRVNQPSHLRLTYQLATGDMVLLEEEFYIGSDRVNRIVALPYTFTVVPPFGVERLVVTASSEEQEEPRTEIRTIGGQRYEVFVSTEAPLVRTRGLVKTQQPSSDAPRVAEATVTITTMRSAGE